MGAPELRIYLRELRTSNNISQKDLAAAMGVAVRTLVAWELGFTDDLKSTSMVRALHALGGSMEDAYHLLLSDKASAVDARHLAQIRLSTPSTIPLTKQPSGPIPITVTTSYAKSLESVLEPIELPFALRAGYRVYEGVRPAKSSEPAYILVNGELFPNVYTAALGRTPGDMEWGYTGQGPRAFAYALVRYECFLPEPKTLGKPEHAVLRRSVSTLQGATQQFVTALPRIGEDIQWTLESTQFALWVKAIVGAVQSASMNPSKPDEDAND